MKAIVIPRFGGPEVLELREVAIPEILPHQVLIEVYQTSVNFADTKARTGNKGQGDFPFIPGLDVAGVVVEIGTAVEHLQIGQRVIAFPANGSYAEYVVANENLTFEIPETINFEMAAACPTVSILSYQLLKNVARLVKGETVLIHSAAGGVGSTLIQLAKFLGAGKVIGTVGDENKAALAKQAGADEVITYEGFSNKVNESTNGRGVNIVLDSVAGRVTEQSLACLAPYGRLVQFGNSSSEVGHVKTSDLHSSCRSVLGFSLGTTRKERPALLIEPAETVLQYIAQGKLTIAIGHRFPLENAVEAHQLIESRKSTGKILLSVRE